MYLVEIRRLGSDDTWKPLYGEPVTLTCLGSPEPTLAEQSMFESIDDAEYNVRGLLPVWEYRIRELSE